jgi:hypothetical protein
MDLPSSSDVFGERAVFTALYHFMTFLLDISFSLPA